MEAWICIWAQSNVIKVDATTGCFFIAQLFSNHSRISYGLVEVVTGGFVDPLKAKWKRYPTLKYLIMDHQGFVDAAAVHCKKLCLKS